MREEAAELEGVTWQPQISRMAKALKRPGDEERWNFLARTAIHKNKVGAAICRAILVREIEGALPRNMV